MTKKKKLELMDMFNHKITWEGWPYVVTGYSDWKEIEEIDLTLYNYIQNKNLQKIRKHLKEVYSLEPEPSPFGTSFGPFSVY